MNKKTFTLSCLFLLVTLLWLGVNIYWDITIYFSFWSTLWAVGFVVFAGLMTWNECKKKKRRHLDEVYKNHIP